MTNLINPKSIIKDQKNPQAHDFRGPSLPRIIPEVKDNNQEMFLHPAEKPQFNSPVYRGFRL